MDMALSVVWMLMFLMSHGTLSSVLEPLRHKRVDLNKIIVRKTVLL